MVAAGSALQGHNGMADILQPCGSSGHMDLSGDKAQQDTSRHLGSLPYLVNTVLLLGSGE